MWKTVQAKANIRQPVQLILDMKVRSSSYLMLDRAERKKDVRHIFYMQDWNLLFFSAVR